MRIFILILLFSLNSVAKTLPATNFKITHDFINKMVNKHHFDQHELELIFSSIELKIADKNKSKTKKKKSKSKTMSWDKYRSLFLTKDRIEKGVEFWKNNLDDLKRAERKFNIPIQIIVAILGIETNYGEKQGTHPTLEAIAKRAFGNYRRKKFYTKELEEFLLLVRDNKIPPLSIKGSYAGALGYAQFIPSSYRYYAIDFDNDNKVDLFNSPSDAIGSIANYFDKHHWHDGGEISRPISLKPNELNFAKSSTNKPKKSAEYFKEKGFAIDADIKEQTKIAFIRMPQKNRVDTYLTFWNFYVLTRYNHDNRYAMAAHHLSEEILSSYQNTNHEI